MTLNMGDLSERLLEILSHSDFLSMKGLANEVPLFIQAYDAAHEDNLRRMVESLVVLLRNKGVAVGALDLFEMVLQELDEHSMLDDLLRNEPTYERVDVLETLQNYSDPKTHLIPRLINAMGSDTRHLTLITGSGRVYPFLRTHTILESLQPAMLRHPVVIFFPGEYIQDISGGSHLRLFGSIPAPVINKAYYRATNLDRYVI